jgi:dihydroxyacetone kinase
VKEADASILNKLYSSLDAVRQKDMKEHVGKSVKNYKAVLEFANATKGK